MAVIVTKQDTSLNTASGFYRVEDYNLGSRYGSTSQQKSLYGVNQDIDITFANAGNCLGAMLMITNNFNSATRDVSLHSDWSVQVELQQKLTPVTITIASPGVVTYNSHGLSDGQAVTLESTGTVPTGLTKTNTYYVVNSATNTFELSLTRGGASINTSGTQSGTHTIWATRLEKILPYTEILNCTNNTASGVLVPFDFDTDGLGNSASSGYAVVTTASLYRLHVQEVAGSGTTSRHWYLWLSYSTSGDYIFAIWCDTAVSFSDDDCVIAKDILTIDKTASMKGVLGAGNTLVAWALIPCRQLTPGTDNVCNVRWENPASAAYTLSIDGCIPASAHCGIQIGTEDNPIPNSEQAKLYYITPTMGTTDGIYPCTGYSGVTTTKASVIMYGETREYLRTTFANPIYYYGGTTFLNIASPGVVNPGTNSWVDGDRVYIPSTTGALPTGVSTGTIYYVRNKSGNVFNLSLTADGALIDFTGTQSGTHYINSVIELSEEVDWVVGDKIHVGTATTRNEGDVSVLKEIAYISGTDMMLTSYLREREINAKAILVSGGFGVKVESDNGMSAYVPGCSNLHIEGVENEDGMSYSIGATIYSWSQDDAANRSKVVITKCSNYVTGGGTSPMLSQIAVPPDGVELSYINAAGNGYVLRAAAHTNAVSGAGKSGSFLIDNNISIGGFSSQFMGTSTYATFTATITNNYFCNASATSTLQGMGVVFSNNTFYGMSNYGIQLASCIGFTGSGNSYENCAVGIYFSAYNTVDNSFSGSNFGQVRANTIDIDFTEGILMQYMEEAPNGSALPTTTYLNDLAPGSYFKITDNDNVTNADYTYFPHGVITRTGSGLADTTVRTAGGYAVRFEPTSSTSTFFYSFYQPTGNIQSKDASVSIWVKLNNAAYYAGTHQMPRLTIDYDNGTEVYAEAAQSTNWQKLIVPFTPTTTYGQVEVTLTGMTDATSTNAYIYWDDMQYSHPSASTLDTGSIDNWANALPVTPIMAIPFSSQTVASDVWEQATASHTTDGTFGKFIQKLLTFAKWIGLK